MVRGGHARGEAPGRWPEGPSVEGELPHGAGPDERLADAGGVGEGGPPLSSPSRHDGIRPTAIMIERVNAFRVFLPAREAGNLRVRSAWPASNTPRLVP